MPNHKHKKHIEKSSRSNKTILLFVLAFAVIASVAILATRAASPAATVEPENGSIASPAVSATDSTASGGKFVQFKKAATGGGTYTIVGAGDIANGSSDAKATGDYIRSLGASVNAVLTFGDDAYSDGAPSDFTGHYEPAWGSFKNNTFPSPGNHDYHTSGASGYYAYFNATATTITGHAVSGVPNKGYYSFNVGPNWRFYSLNTEANQSEANTWLDADLKAHPTACAVAYWHQPAYTSPSDHGNNSSAQTYFKTLYNNNADIVFVGHNHAYERMVPINGSGVSDPTRGILNMTIGTGGAGEGSSYQIHSPVSTSVTFNPSDVWGVLKLTAHDDGSYKVDFVRTSGSNYTDTYSGHCH